VTGAVAGVGLVGEQSWRGSHGAFAASESSPSESGVKGVALEAS
jgi:hypothetical protein